jgi:alkyl sulfatase BDS1-like metallo-beta-lactamase superfamily hydrolase
MATPAPTPKDASPFTAALNRAVLTALPFADTQDFDDARHGLVATLPEVEIKNDQGRIVWSLRDYAFLGDEQAPPTVNPSLWRLARLNLIHGLFQVTDRIYQIRGFDISNMTVIEGDHGLIVIDPLVSTEVARAALELYMQHRGRRPVSAVIYSHSHTDHYGGVRGVVDERDVSAGRVHVWAPDRFMEEVVSEAVLAGTAMVRRAQFQFGATLPKGPRGQVDAGLGKGLSRGTVTLIPPTRIIKEPIEAHRIDGVEIVFQLTPETEAPAEMHMFYPALRALNLAENATHTLHNIYPIRGAQARDANAWAKYLNAARDRFGREADVAFAQHHWPVWGNARVLEFLGKQRDLYKYLHDQTMRLVSHGYKAAEIAERLTLPKSLGTSWHVRGYYGTLSHNAKSVYQRYIGWYDANPANLNPLPPVERGRKYVEYMGGAEAVIRRARDDFARGEYRFVAEAMSHVVFADPANAQARQLGADALEQLGYAAESATWRNAYVLGALELRQGLPAAVARACEPRSRAGDEPRPLLRLSRRAAQRRQGRGPAQRHQLGILGSGPALRDESRELRAHLPARSAARGGRRDGDPRARGVEPAGLARGLVRRRGHARPRADRRRYRQGRRPLRVARRLQLDVRGRGAEAGAARRSSTACVMTIRRSARFC